MNRNTRKSKGHISVITIVRNGVNEIEETIKSVLNQNLENIEYIVIDGASTDGTLGIINKYSERISRIVSEPDNGIYDAINKGIKLTTGDLIGLIHCGDRYEENTLYLCYEKFLKTRSDIIYGDIKILDYSDGIQLEQLLTANHESLRRSMSIFHPATFISRACYNHYGFYNDKYKIAADYEFFLRSYLKGASFEYFPITMAAFRSGGISSNFCQLISELFSIWKNCFGNIRAIHLTMLRISSNVWYITRKNIAIFIIGKKKYDELKRVKYKLND